MTDDSSDFLEGTPELDWPEDRDEPERDDSQLVGMASTGMPVLYSSQSNVIYQGEVNDDGRVTPRFEDEVEVDSDETLGDALRSFGDRVGWESLSEYGEEHWDGEEPPTG